jgi:hypothetical protein
MKKVFESNAAEQTNGSTCWCLDGDGINVVRFIFCSQPQKDFLSLPLTILSFPQFYMQNPPPRFPIHSF